MAEIIESGMSFLIDDDMLYHIESTKLYESFGDGIKRPEFLMLDPKGRLAFVEAKKSSPKPESKNFDKWIGEIADKFTNALIAFNAVRTGRHPVHASEMNNGFRKIPLDKAEYRFYLIINGHEPQWLPPIADALRLAMTRHIRLWNIDDISVKVLNHKLALDMNIITAYDK